MAKLENLIANNRFFVILFVHSIISFNLRLCKKNIFLKFYFTFVWFFQKIKISTAGFDNFPFTLLLFLFLTPCFTKFVVLMKNIEMKIKETRSEYFFY